MATTLSRVRMLSEVSGILNDSDLRNNNGGQSENGDGQSENRGDDGKQSGNDATSGGGEGERESTTGSVDAEELMDEMSLSDLFEIPVKPGKKTLGTTRTTPIKTRSMKNKH